MQSSVFTQSFFTKLFAESIRIKFRVWSYSDNVVASL